MTTKQPVNWPFVAVMVISCVSWIVAVTAFLTALVIEGSIDFLFDYGHINTILFFSFGTVSMIGSYYWMDNYGSTSSIRYERDDNAEH